MNYKFFDESYNSIDKLSSDDKKTVYVAVRMTSGEQTSGVIFVNIALPQGTITTISDDEAGRSLLDVIADLCSTDRYNLYWH